MARNTRRIARIGAIVGIAAATGYFMQADEPAARAVAAAPVPAPMPPSDATRAAEAAAPAAPAGSGTVVITTVPDIVAPRAASAIPTPVFAAVALPQDAAPLPAPPEVVPASIPAPQQAADEPDTVPDTVPAEAVTEDAPVCPEALDIVASPGAMLTLVLTAPCRSGERVVLRHAGLAVSLQTSSVGTLTASVPAFDPAGEVAVQFADGRRLVGAAPVADLAGIARFAVQFMVGDSFHLHAFAEGAGFGDRGHVHAGAPGQRGGAAGHLVALGDASLDRALLAEVFTFPADRGAVSLELEAPVNSETCGRDILGETLQWSDRALTLRDLSVEMPPCGEGDGFLLLQNPMADLTLAAN
jgi:hypothetical protein